MEPIGRTQHMVSPGPTGAVALALAPANAVPARGRAAQRRPSADAFERPQGPQQRTAFADALSARSLSPGHVHFAPELEAPSATPVASRRRRSGVQLEAESLMSRWAELRERVDHDAQAAAGVQTPPEFRAELEHVQQFVLRCADQVSLARKRARMSLAQLRCISRSAVDLHGSHGLSAADLQFDESDPESMAAIVRTVLGALDCEGPNGPRTLPAMASQSPSTSPPRLALEATALDADWVEVPRR